MNELIKITTRKIGEVTVNAVNARDLHLYLGVGRDFSNWMKDQIQRARLVECRDFEVFALLGENSEGRPRQEYALTLDAAKHVAMMSGTDKGFEVRDYFIECERQANDPIHALLTMSRPEMLEMAAKLAREKEALHAKTIEQQATISTLEPKAQFCDRVSQAKNAIPIGEFAKLLGTGQNRLFRELRRQNVFMNNNIPYQKYLNQGLFEVIEQTWTDRNGSEHVSTKTLITGKGQVHFEPKLNKATVRGLVSR